jgi:hypothetical protein
MLGTGNDRHATSDRHRAAPSAVASGACGGRGAVSGGNLELSWQEGDRSTHFMFEHKVFQVKGARFSMTADGTEPAFFVTLGDLRAAIRLPALRNEFGIDPDSSDGKLLAIIERSLRYVKEIRAGDSIPRELLDGSASWSVEERHRSLAKARLSVQLASWITGEESTITDAAMLQQLVEDPETKARMQKAMTEIAEKLGLGADRRQEVVDLIDDLARELAYIEALRDRYGLVRMIVGKVNLLSRLYRADRGMVQDLSRIRSLMLRPTEEFENIFGQVDAMTCEILTVLRKFDAQVQFIRQMRDDLHTRLMTWDPIIEQWQMLDAVGGAGAELAIKDLYRFVARHFPQQQNWRVAR